MATASNLLTNPLGGITNSFQASTVLNAVGWIIFAVIVISAVVLGYWWWWTKKQFSKNITAFDIIGIYYEPVIRDQAKQVKLGRGGFEILYLRKLKIYRIAYGGRIGRNTYYFFIGKDGYWYNGMLSSQINEIDARGGLIPIVTTNPNMRSQYTALEKMIDTLDGDKLSFMDKYGQWIFTITFVMIVGIFAWLIYREMTPLMSQFTTLVDKLGQLTDRMNSLLANTNNVGKGSGLVQG